MTSRLEVVKPEVCIGCYLCSLSFTRLKNSTVSLAESPLRIQRDGRKFLITLDGLIGEEGNIIVAGCPRGCFSITHAG